MDGNQVSTTALVALAVVPILATSILSLLTGYLSQRQAGKQEHRTWLLEQRYEAYTALTMILYAVSSEKDAEQDRRKELRKTFEEAFTKSLMLSDDTTQSYLYLRCAEFWGGIDSDRGKAGQALVNLRTELGAYLLYPAMRNNKIPKDLAQRAEEA